MIQVSNWSEKKCNKKSWLHTLICTYFYVHSCKNARFVAIFVKHTCSKIHQHLQSLQNKGLCWIQVAASNTCVECVQTSHMGTKYTCIHLNWGLKHKIKWNTPHIKPIHVSTILWTCPQKCGHYPNTNLRIHLQNCSHTFTSKYSHRLLPMVHCLA